jgi:hypothetical protein
MAPYTGLKVEEGDQKYTRPPRPKPWCGATLDPEADHTVSVTRHPRGSTAESGGTVAGVEDSFIADILDTDMYDTFVAEGADFDIAAFYDIR